MEEKDKRICKNCKRFGRTKPRQIRRCLDNILRCRECWNDGCCLWFDKA